MIQKITLKSLVSKEKYESKFYVHCYVIGWHSNGEPAVLIHHSIVCRWRCGSLVTQRRLSLLLSMT